MPTRPSRGEAPQGATVIASLTNGSPWTRQLPNKVPTVSLRFWGLTILSTMVGASSADFLSANLGLGPGLGPGLGLGLGMSATTAIVTLAVAGALIAQLSTGRLVRGSYWLVLVLVSVLGTLVSDDLVDQLGVSLWSATGILCAALAVCFTGWSCTEHSLSVRSVVTRRCEAWYWLAVLCAVSLATAVSDLVSATLSLGYASLVLCCLAAVMTGAHARVKVHGVAAFWAAYVVTRTLGDSVADLMSAPARDGALGLGTIGTVAIVLVVILVFVVLSTAAAHRSGAGQVGSPTVRP